MSSSPPFPEETFRAVVEGASDAIFITDGALRIEWVNPEASQLLRYPREVLVGRRIADLLWDEKLLASDPLQNDELCAGQTTKTLRTFRTGDGARLVLEVTARSIGGGRLVGIARDATARLEAQAKLARSEASFRALIEGSPDGIVVHRDGVTVYANSALATLLGWPSASAFIGRPVLELVHPDDREQVRLRMRALHDHEEAVPFTEERLVRLDGEPVTCSIGGINLVFEGTSCVAAIVRDVTEARKMQTRLALADRMASLGVLAAGVAHEINNPLTYVMLRLDAIASVRDDLSRALGSVRRDAADVAEALAALEEHVVTARDGAERVRRIVGDLRVFARQQDQPATPTDVRAALELALGIAAHELKHRARVVRTFGDVPRVLASEGRLAQVFLNLILNAAQAIPEGDPQHHEVRVRTGTDADDVVIEIEDTGAGIAASDLPHLFEPFFTTKPVGVGTGLGLAICHGIVDTLGGTIRVDSVPGRTRFSVVLPAVRAASVPPPDVEPSVEEAKRRGRVLVIDDEVAIGRTLVDALAPMGDVIAVDSAFEAQKLLQRGEVFDVILCDVRMPQMSGPDLYRWIVRERPELHDRVLFMTGGRVASEERAIVGEGDERVLEKPFDLRTVEARVSSMLGLEGAPFAGARGTA